jgi:hypothetical protein
MFLIEAVRLSVGFIEAGARSLLTNRPEDDTRG